MLRNKSIVSIANGLSRSGREFVPVMPAEGSIAEAVQDAVPGAKVLGAFQLLPAKLVAALDNDLVSEVSVVGDDPSARGDLIELIDRLPGLRGVHAGPLVNARGVEAFTAAILTANRHHGGEGVARIVGLGERP